MKTKTENTCVSWLAGKYEIDTVKVEINTAYDYISIIDEEHDIDYYWQGQTAVDVINEINEIYNNNSNFTQEGAVRQYIYNNI